jgi:predicted negative regulator of RcsB-dependent stress response
MSVYMTEEEQLAVIKRWWQRYSTTITVVLSLILLAISGVKYWHWHEEKLKTQASVAFEQMMQAVSNQDNKSIRAYANQIIQDYPQSVYSDAAYLTLSKVYVAKVNYKKAETVLQTIVNTGNVPVFKQIAKIRLARLLANEKSFQQALAVLSVVDDEAYMPVVEELKGDVYAAKGQFQKAVVAYRAAMSSVKHRGMGNLYLEMKTNELAAKASTQMSLQSKTESV